MSINEARNKYVNIKLWWSSFRFPKPFFHYVILLQDADTSPVSQVKEGAAGTNRWVPKDEVRERDTSRCGNQTTLIVGNYKVEFVAVGNHTSLDWSLKN